MQLVANHTIDEIFPPFKCEGVIRAIRKIMLNHSREQEKQKWALVF